MASQDFNLASLRSIPNLNVLRPCDQIETFEAWEIALNSKEIVLEDSEIALIPENTLNADLDTSLKVYKLLESLEDLDDTQTVTSNVEFSDDLLEHLD